MADRNEYTAGPWHVQHGTATVLCGTTTIAKVLDHYRNAEANARLIAKSPCAYALLEEVFEYLCDLRFSFGEDPISKHFKTDKGDQLDPLIEKAEAWFSEVGGGPTT